MKSRLFGVLLLLETAALLLTAMVAWYYHLHAGEDDYHAFLTTAAITGSIGLVLYLIGSKRKRGFDNDDTFVIVSLTWILYSVFGMLPFLLSGALDNVTDAFFETISGFSTTGSTILRDVDGQTHGILFWRSIMQWMGGLGVIVFSLAFIPSVAKGSGKMSLFAAEAPGVSIEKLAPTMQGTARILWTIYIILTILCAFAYWMGPMNLFDAICHALTTIATGGFSTHQQSMGYFQSNYLDYVCVGFMLLSGVNFAMFHFLFRGRFDLIRKNEELKVYLVSTVVLIVTFIGLFYLTPSFSGVTESQLAEYPHGRGETIRTSVFHVVSVLSNTGFAGQNSNYDTWGVLFVILTVLMMVVGGCAGSASGGIKLVRVIVLVKVIRNEIKELLHPTGMFTVKVSDQAVEELSLRRVCNFLSWFLLLFVINAIVLSLTGMSLEDACIAFLTFFSNLGSGSGITGPSACLADLPTAAKWILSVDMLIGRLEIITILLVFTRSAWVTTRS